MEDLLNSRNNLGNIKLGEHLCWIYKDENIAAVISFLAAGLGKNEKCLYAGERKEDVIEAFKKTDIDIFKHIRTGRFQFLNVRDIFLKNRRFNPDRMIEFWKESEKEVLKSGFSGLRIIGNGTFLAEAVKPEKLIEYEAKLNHFFPGSSCAGVCQYEEKRLKPEILLDLICTHPKLILDNIVCENHYYTLPDAFLARIKGKISRQFYEQTKDNIIEGAKIKLERHKEAITLQEIKERYRNVLDNLLEGCQIIGFDWRYFYLNDAVSKHGKRAKKDFIGKTMMEIYPGIEKTEMFVALRNCMEKRIPHRMETQFFFPDNTNGWFELNIQPVPEGIFILSHDITERKLGEKRIKKLFALQSAIKDINEELLKSRNEPELFQRICESLIRTGYVRFAWIGLIEKGGFEVKPAAWAGFEDGFLSTIKVRWDDSTHGNGPTGIAIKTGRPFVISDVETDSNYLPWREEALKRGYRTSISLPLISGNEKIGAFVVYSEIKDAFDGEEVEFLKEVAGDIAVGIKSLRLEGKLKQSYKSLHKVLNQGILAITELSDLRDPYTGGHMRRVAQLATAIARKMNFSGEQVEGIQVTSLLHDIGKISTPAEVLSKPGRLNENEFEMIKSHPQVGYNLLKKVDFPWPVARTVFQHHERLNSSGYPLGLPGREISLEAKIIAVADVIEAMSSHRPYRPALGIEKALEEVKKNKGILYDPGVVDVCVGLFTDKKFSFK